MDYKFSNLLKNSQEWKVIFDGKEYSKKDILKIVYHNGHTWGLKKINFPSDNYILAIGGNSFHYFIYLLLASAFNLKIIFVSLKQLKYFDDNKEDLSFATNYIISNRAILKKDRKNLVLSIEYPEDEDKSLDGFNIHDNRQAEIVFCTSGTTSNFKLTRYHEKTLYDNANMVGNYMDLSRQDKCLCLFPFNYMYGFSATMSVLIKGGTVILERPTITPQRIIEYLTKDEITLLPIIGKTINDIMPHIKSNLFSPKLKIINASDKIYKDHVKKIFKLAPVFWNNMGQTESGPRLLTIRIDKENENNLDDYSYNNVIALGYPANQRIDILIKKGNGQECQANEIGELHYRTPFTMTEYMNCKNNDINGWRNSGDVAFKNKDGMIYWVGRKTQVVKVNGFFININLVHVFFDKLSFIKKSFFVVDDKRDNNIYGFFNIDWILAKDEDSVIGRIYKYYTKFFPLYPRPNKIVFVDNFPKTESGKINLKKLMLLV